MAVAYIVQVDDRDDVDRRRAKPVLGDRVQLLQRLKICKLQGRAVGERQLLLDGLADALVQHRPKFSRTSEGSLKLRLRRGSLNQVLWLLSQRVLRWLDLAAVSAPEVLNLLNRVEWRLVLGFLSLRWLLDVVKVLLQALEHGLVRMGLVPRDCRPVQKCSRRGLGRLVLAWSRSVLAQHRLLLRNHVLVARRRNLRHRRGKSLPAEVSHLHLEVFFEENAWLDEVMIVQVAPLVVPEVLGCAPTQELEPEKTLVGLLLATVEELLRSVARVEGLFVLTNDSEAVLQGCVFDLLGDLLVLVRRNQLKQ